MHPDLWPRLLSYQRIAILFSLALLWSGCVQPLVMQPPTPTPHAVPTFTPTPVGAATAEQAAEVAAPEIPAVKPLTVALSPALPEKYAVKLVPLLLQLDALETAAGSQPLELLDQADVADVTFELVALSQAAGTPLVARFYAAVVPFDTVQDDTTLAALAARWRGEGEGVLVAPVEHMAELAPLFGTQVGQTAVMTATHGVLDALAANPGSIGLLPFDQLDPRYKVLTVDGFNVLSNQLDAMVYPLAVALVTQGESADLLAGVLATQIDEPTNRQAGELTTLLMTGVTAMSRVTALRMEQRGYTYPAEVISATLAAADITHISNEVPFLDDCVVDASANNLVLCSHTNYWATLEAVGTDIVGLSGNHVNDFGRDGARRSLTWYRENEIPIYGSGMNVEEACAPLMWEHNGNTFAFFAALAFYPEFAWATEDQPGACYYFTNKERILAQIEELRDDVDIIAVELQHTETYNPFPIGEQIADFRELREAGVDIVTGVQSHVPQAMEPYGSSDTRDPSFIAYGLGNLFFDQMWSWETRTELMARHTIYQGRLLSTEILTAVLEDYAQPRWATPDERAEILQRIFNAAPARP